MICSYHNSIISSYNSKTIRNYHKVGSHYNLKVGIENTVLEYITSNVRERLPVIYEEYLLKKQLGVPIDYIEKESPRDDDKASSFGMDGNGKAVRKRNRSRSKKNL